MENFTYAYKLLIVDKDSQTMATAQSVLTMKSYSIQSATDTSSAYDVVNTWLPDMILLDVSHPDSNSLAFLKQVKSDKRFRNTPVIVCVDLNSREVMGDAFEAGATDSICKPLRKDELLNRITFYRKIQEQQTLIIKLQEKQEKRDRNYMEVSGQVRSSLNAIRLMDSSLLHTLGKDSIEKDEYDLLLNIYNETAEAALAWDNFGKYNNFHPDLCKPRRQRVDINSILSNIANAYQPIAQQKGITLFKEGFDSELPADVDIEMFRTVVRNLLSNAIRFNNEGGQVVLSSYAAPEDRCVVKIHRPAVNKCHTKEQDSAGWELCNNYAQAHKGKIWIEAKENQGTASYFSFTC